MTKSTVQLPTPEQIFDAALKEVGPDANAEEVRLLLAGYDLLKMKKEKPLNKPELFSITSLVSFVAYKQGAHEETIIDVTASHFETDDIKSIPSQRYDDVLEFLLDLNISEVIN